MLDHQKLAETLAQLGEKAVKADQSKQQCPATRQFRQTEECLVSEQRQLLIEGQRQCENC